MPEQSEKAVHVRYFAILREQRGLVEETITTRSATAVELYAELQARHHFSLSQNFVKVSVNNTFQPMNTPLHDQDLLVFIPPVAGG